MAKKATAKKVEQLTGAGAAVIKQRGLKIVKDDAPRTRSDAAARVEAACALLAARGLTKQQALDYLAIVGAGRYMALHKYGQ